MNFIALSYWDLALASVLIVLNAILSLVFRLGLEKRLLVAAVRMVVQLMLIGLVLRALFALVSPAWTALAAVVMVLAAGREVHARMGRRFAGLWTYGLGTGSMLVAGFLVTALALTTQVQPDPWYDPRFALPLLGMILGNTMTAIALGLDSLTNAAVGQRRGIEARLALGHDRRQALSGVVRSALRVGMMPIVNSMAVAGLVSLPGMMTGQILGGVDPVEAVKYQILIFFLISGGVVLGVLLSVHLGARRLTDSRHRLRVDRLAGGGEA